MVYLLSRWHSWAAPLGMKTAMAIFVVPCVVANVWQALAGPHFPQLVRRLWTYLVMGCIGTWFGVGVLAGTSDDLLLALLGGHLVHLFPAQPHPAADPSAR